jgi:cobalt-zinc-cadmium efflux system outer membrane protein
LAAAGRSRARFGSFFDDSRDMGSAALEGDLSLSGALPAAEEAMTLALANRTDLRALHEEGRHQELERKAARRRRFPNPTLMAGWKRTEALDESDTGFVASLMVPLPLFDRGTFAEDYAGVVAQQVDLRKELLEREIRSEVMAALAGAQAARDAVEQLGAAAEQRAVELRHITQLAYDEGEKDILELLDVLRSSLRMERQLLALQHEAKLAQIELNRVMGQEVGP